MKNRIFNFGFYSKAFNFHVSIEEGTNDEERVVPKAKFTSGHEISRNDSFVRYIYGDEAGVRACNSRTELKRLPTVFAAAATIVAPIQKNN